MASGEIISNGPLSEIDQAYFDAHGTYPPIISPDTPPEEISKRIENVYRMARDSRNLVEASRLMHEADYLKDRLNRG